MEEIINDPKNNQQEYLHELLRILQPFKKILLQVMHAESIWATILLIKPHALVSEIN